MSLARWIVSVCLMLVVLCVSVACGPVTNETPIPDTPTPTDTPQPPAPTPTKVVPTPTLAPNVLVGSPISQFFVPLTGQVSANGGVFTLRRVEFWLDTARAKPQNGFFAVIVGELAGANGLNDCSKSDEFVLSMDTRRFATSSSLLEPFKDVYQWDYPGSFFGLCLAKPQATYVVFDLPFQLSAARLMFRDAPLELGDLNAALAKAKFPLPSLEAQWKILLERALGASQRNVPRVAEVKVSEAAGGKNVVVTWAIEDNRSDVGKRDGAKADAAKIFQTLYTSGVNIAQVEARGTFRAADVFGNASEDVVLRVALDKATAAKINWANFQSANLFQVAKLLDAKPPFKE